MANSITAVADAAQSLVTVRVELDGATVTGALVERTADGGTTWSAVRSGDVLRLIGPDPGATTRIGYVVDSEMPLNTTLTYRATAQPTLLVVSTSSLSVTGGAWLKDPARPWANVPLRTTRYVHDCAPGAEPLVTLARLDSEDYAPDATLMPVLNRSRPGDVYGYRKDASTAFRAVSHTLDSAQTMNIFWAWGGPVLLQLPAAYGWADRYYQPGATLVSRVSRDMSVQDRVWDVPLDTVDAPVGPAQGTAENNWCTVADCYATYTDFAASGLTWGDVVEGDASC